MSNKPLAAKIIIYTALAITAAAGLSFIVNDYEHSLAASQTAVNQKAQKDPSPDFQILPTPPNSIAAQSKFDGQAPGSVKAFDPQQQAADDQAAAESSRKARIEAQNARLNAIANDPAIQKTPYGTAKCTTKDIEITSVTYKHEGNENGGELIGTLINHCAFPVKLMIGLDMYFVDQPYEIVHLNKGHDPSETYDQTAWIRINSSGVGLDRNPTILPHETTEFIIPVVAKAPGTAINVDISRVSVMPKSEPITYEY